MLKKILIGIGLLLLLLGGAMLYMNNRNRTLSPPAEQKITTQGGLTVRIDYSRPSKRERLIFGTIEQEALQPFGIYWRLGANEATVVEFDKKVSINNVEMEPGSYALYAIPRPDHFEIGVNKTWDRWGYSEPDYSQDITRMKVPIEAISESVEQFTINLGETEDGVKIICEWDKMRFVIPVVQLD